MRVIICGAGIAGLSLAQRLVATGWDVTAIERSPTPRQQGYMIDFWGLGYDAAQSMGVLPRLGELSYRVEEACFVDEPGHRFCLTETTERQMGFYALCDGRIATFTVHRNPDPALPEDTQLAVRQAYSSLGWVAPRALARCPDSAEVYYDQVAQIEIRNGVAVGSPCLVTPASRSPCLLAKVPRSRSPAHACSPRSCRGRVRWTPRWPATSRCGNP